MEGGDKLPLLTVDASRLTLSDADREAKLPELVADGKKDDKPVPSASTAFEPAVAPPVAPPAASAPQ
jgi:hypothetical protein